MRKTTLLLFALILGAALAMAGCANTPQRNAYVTIRASTAAVNGVSDAYVAKVITKDQLKAIEPYADAVLAAQKTLGKATLAGKVDLSVELQALTDAFTNLANAKADAVAANTPTTQP